MLKIIGIAVVLILVAGVAILAYAATKPDTFRVQRSVGIKAPPEKIFPLINEFDHWSAWSPYEKKDPAMKRSRSGPPGGKGAVYAWEGDSNVGEGRMEILESSPPSKVAIKLDFIKPFEAHNIAEFTMEPRGDTTHVTWAIHGPNLFIGKVMSIFINMDKMIGNDFEQGLNSLKTIAEK